MTRARNELLSDPQLEPETMLLGAILADGQLLAHLGAPLEQEHFAEPLHGRIFERAKALHAEGRGVSPITLMPYFANDLSLQQLGGVGYLARLAGLATGGILTSELAREIFEGAQRRALAAHFSASADAVLDHSLPVGETVANVEAWLRGIDTDERSLHRLDLAALSQREPIEQEFAIEGVVPRGEPALFSGPGGAGKSTLAMLISAAIAASSGTVLGIEVMSCPVIYVAAEDGEGRLHWSAHHQCRQLGINLQDLAGRLHIVSRRGAVDSMLGVIGPDGVMRPSAFFRQLRCLLTETGADLVVLDNVAHVFPGNENDRREVTQFANLLTSLGVTVILVAHPNKGGDSYSGSTAWPNAFRVQFTLSRPDKDDPELRTITVEKANYSRSGEIARFRWHDHSFALEADLPASASAELFQTSRAARDNTIFLACLAERTRLRRSVSDRHSPTFAPTVFVKMPEANGLSKERLEMAMERLFRIGRIERAALWKGEDRKDVYGLREVLAGTAVNTAGDSAGDTVRGTACRSQQLGAIPAASAGDGAGNTHLPPTEGEAWLAMRAATPSPTGEASDRHDDPDWEPV